ncbi:unnamed protein product [[Candida] boidinii]|nr:unnamed protein product [[Candida] boidinii]
MYNTVSEKLFTNDMDYQGRKLFQRIVTRYGTITRRSRYVQICAAISQLSSKTLSPAAATSLIHDLATNALNGVNMEEFLLLQQ